MQDSPPILFVFLIVSGAAGLSVLVAGLRIRPAGFSPVPAVVAALPGLLFTALFHSLAFHMHRSLGGWPESFGREGFPPALVAHADAAGWGFTVGVVLLLLAWPVACVLAASVRRWRGILAYLGVFAITCAGALGAMMLAPDGFLRWWWD